MDEGTRIRTGDRLGWRRGRFSLSTYLVLLCLAAAAIALFQWRENRSFFRPDSLLSRFPAEDGIALHIDFKIVRDAGLLTASKAGIEPEYKQFVDGTGLDYRRDLDLVVASFSKSGNYFIARGRFDWKRLRDYAAHQGGSCYRDLCRMPGSTPERHISFLPLRDDTIALAVSTDDLAAARLIHTGPPLPSHLPAAPVWFSVPGPVLRQRTSLPPGLRLVLSSLVKADRILITMGSEGTGMEAHLDANCHSPEDARVLASQLRSTTGMLKEALLTNKEASQDDLARALAAGTFDAAGSRVTGKWPVGRSLIDSLTSGI